MTEKAPNPQQEQFTQDFEQARQSALEAGKNHYFAVGGRTGGVSIGETEAFSPNMTASRDRDHFRYDVSKLSPADTYQNYEGVITEGYDGKDLAQAKVYRKTESGETYEHAFKDPNTARKFGSLVAKQVARRAQADIETGNSKAA